MRGSWEQVNAQVYTVHEALTIMPECSTVTHMFAHDLLSHVVTVLEEM
jgi:hypothetical protein